MTKTRVRILFLSVQLLILVVFGLATLFCSPGCVPGNYQHRQITRFYSPTGIYTGKSIKSRSITRYYSTDGKFLGTSRSN
jgi:hypothetical protein